MSTPNRGILIAGAFIMPVVCCFFGAGAFVHLATSFTQEEQQKHTNLNRELEEKIDAANATKDKLARVKDRISQLRGDLRTANARGKAEQKVEEQLPSLKSSATKLENELSSLRQKVAKAEACARRLDSLRLKVIQLKLYHEDLRANLKVARSKHRQLLPLHDGVLKMKEERQKVFSVTALSGRGSRRVPASLFAECRANGIIIQPAKRRLSASMDPKDQSIFLSMARKTRYVVFLIRPDGFESFRRYRGLVISENRLLGDPIDIGFEPVNADWTLIYPEKGRRAYAKLNER